MKLSEKLLQWRDHRPSFVEMDEAIIKARNLEAEIERLNTGWQQANTEALAIKLELSEELAALQARERELREQLITCAMASSLSYLPSKADGQDTSAPDAVIKKAKI